MSLSDMSITGFDCTNKFAYLRETFCEQSEDPVGWIVQKLDFVQTCTK